MLELFSGGVALAQTPSPAAAAQSAGTVQGSIKDNSGAPVANARVALRGPVSQSTTSDTSGNFSFTGLPAGLYTLTATSPGHETATQPDITVVTGQTQTLAIVMPVITFQSVRTIASVRAVGRGTFNTTPASVSVVSSQTLIDQAQPQVMKVLNETPGIVASLPQTSANGAAPGAITFPNIRGALSFETASLVDGHPVSVGSFGDYVTTFLNPFMLQDIEVVKGPGANAPEVNYAIGGTVNFVTKNPTYQPSVVYQFGADNWGSAILNFSYSNTSGRLGYVFAYSSNDLESNVSNASVFVSPQSPQQGIFGFNGVSGTAFGFNDVFPTPPVPGTVSTNTNAYNLVACCQQMSAVLFENQSELAKLRYQLSPASFLTFAYLGSQTRTNQAANTGDITHSTFSLANSGASPGQIASYTGSIPNNSPLDVGFVRTPEYEINNEPILQGDFRTTIHNDTVLARYYAAGIHRLLYQGSTNPFVPTVLSMKLYGYDTATNQVYNGQTVPVTFFDYFNQAEDDVLKGYSIEYDHPFANDDVLTFSADTTHSTTTSYSLGVSGPSAGRPFDTSQLFLSQSITLPTGSLQNFTTLMLRGLVHAGPKLTATLSNYFNIYRNTVPTSCQAISITFGNGHCNFDGSGTTGSANGVTPGLPAPGYVFASTTTTHYDPRLALEYRPDASTALRFSIGSAIAPPFLAELTTLPGAIAFSSQTGIATEQLQSAGLKPETAFGFDIGADHRFNDGVTFVTADLYYENLFNHFLTQLSNSGASCPAIDPNTGAPTPSGCAGSPLFFKQNINVANSRFEGVELGIRRVPVAGFGFSLQGALERGYAYNLPVCFYGSAAVGGAQNCSLTTNLAVIPGSNFTGGGINGSMCYDPSTGTFTPLSSTGSCTRPARALTLGVGGFSNQNVPYSQGYGELNYRTRNGWYGNVNLTYYGPNNSLNAPAFTVLGATLRAPLIPGMTLQISGDNLTNQHSNVWPAFGSGLPIALANGQFAATQANVYFPRTVRFVLTKTFGAASTATP
jgi:outer membrane receptor protein involved in Fe transport